MQKVGLFFFADKQFLLHTCELDKAENYGDFLGYSFSHDEIWNRKYADSYGVDFDYYPRGRIVYRKSDETFLIYYDSCVEDYIRILLQRLGDAKYELLLDEHYRCHVCNKDYYM